MILKTFSVFCHISLTLNKVLLFTSNSVFCTSLHQKISNRTLKWIKRTCWSEWLWIHMMVCFLFFTKKRHWIIKPVCSSSIKTKCYLPQLTVIFSQAWRKTKFVGARSSVFVGSRWLRTSWVLLSAQIVLRNSWSSSVNGISEETMIFQNKTKLVVQFPFKRGQCWKPG